MFLEHVDESIDCGNFSANSGTIKRDYFVLLKLRVLSVTGS